MHIFCTSPRIRHLSKELSTGYARCYWDFFVFNIEEEMLKGLVIFWCSNFVRFGKYLFLVSCFYIHSFVQQLLIEYHRAKLNGEVQIEQSVQVVYQKGDIPGN